MARTGFDRRREPGEMSGHMFGPVDTATLRSQSNRPHTDVARAVASDSNMSTRLQRCCAGTWRCLSRLQSTANVVPFELPTPRYQRSSHDEEAVPQPLRATRDSGRTRTIALLEVSKTFVSLYGWPDREMSPREFFAPPEACIRVRPLDLASRPCLPIACDVPNTVPIFSQGWLLMT